MIIPAHLAGGYLALRLVDKLQSEMGFRNNEMMVIGILGAILPDIDSFRFKYIKDHHDSFTHLPLFWVLAFSLACGLEILFKIQIVNYTIALFLGIFTHLFLDWLSGRTTGIKIFYPLSKKAYSLFKINPDKGKIPISLLPNRENKDFLVFYWENKFLFFVEIGIIIFGLGYLLTELI